MTEPIVTTTGAVLNTPHGELPLVAHFTYTLSDPLAVAMTLVAELPVCGGRVFTEQTTWVFARTLIDEAMTLFIPTGDGDVTVTYLAGPDVLQFDLTDIHENKHALFVDAAPVVDFMAETFAAAPADLEIVDVDAAILQILDVDAAAERLRDGTWES